MKKHIAILCVMAIALLGIAFTGCGDKADKYADSPYVGTWTATEASYSGITLGVEDILGGEFSMALAADGTVELTVVDKTESGTWEPTDDGVKLEGDDDLTFTEEDGALILDYDGVTMIFEKK